MKLLKRGAVLIGALLMTLLMSVGVFADEAWTKADVTNSSIGVSKQTTELKSLSYIADEGISLNVDNDKVSVSGKGIGTGSTVYVSNSTDTEAGLANATYNKVDNGAKTGIVYFDSKKIDVRHVTSYFNIKIETGSKSTVIKVKTTVAYGDLYVYAFQMNTKHDDGAVSEYNPSYRVVNYCGNVLAKGNDLIPVRGFGTVYGINGTFTKNDLVKNSSNANVYSFDATEQGLVDVKNATQWDNYYAVTFKNLSYNPELLDRSYTLRPYAILEDGSIMYSDDVQSTSIYDVANVLYERNAMSTKEARTFLYKHILNIVKLKNNYVNICKNMLHVLNVTDANSADYKFVNALYKDLYCYAQLTQNYENAHYYDRDNFVAKTFVDGQDPNTVLLDKLNKAAETDYDTILDWINFESPKNGVEGGYVPAGVYENGKLTKDWSDLVKDGDVVVDDETLKSVSDNVNGDLQLPESIKKIESAKGSNLDTVTVPSTVEEISDDAFTEVPKVIYNGDATGARWGADITIVKGNSIKIPVYAGYNSNNKTLYFAKTAKELEDAGVTENYGDISSVGFTKYNSAPWYSINWQITKVNFLSEIKPTSCSYWFYCFTSLADIDNIQNLNTKNVTNMSYMFSYCGALTSLDVSNFDTSKVTRMDWMFYNCYILTSLDLSNFDTRKVTDMSYMLGLCNEVTSLDVSNFDTSKVTRMNGMFSGCRALTTLNVSNFDTSKVTDMSSMFSYCSKLTTLDVSNFDTSKVAYMGSMFDGCTSLTTLKLGVFNTSKSSYSSIFSGMRANATLYTISPNTKNWILKLSSSDRPSIWTSDNIKVYCNKNEAGHNFEIITTDQTCTEDGKQTKTCTYCGYKEETILKAGHDFKVVTNENGKELICSRCNEHREYDDYVIDIISNTNYIQDGNKFTSNIKGVSKGNSSIELKLTFYKTTTLNFKYKVSSESSCDKGSLVIDGITIADKISGTNKAEQIYSRTFEPGTYTITSQYTKDSTTDKGDDCFYFSLNNPIFAGYNASNNTLYFANKQSEIKNTGIDLTSDNYYGDISKIDFTSTSAPWGNNSNITQITFLSEIKPTSCAYWFYDFDKLTGIDNIQNLNTSNVTNMCYMFNNCSKLTTLDLSNLNTSKVTDMSYMFSYCSKLTTLDVSNFDTSKATRMNGMFNNCSSLTTLDVSNFDTRNVTYMSSMFSNCSKLTTLDLSSFDTSKVTDISSMFFNCTSLTTLNVSNFDTSKVTDMSYMFSGCSSLTSLDISDFDTSKVTYMSGMFNNCSSLTTLDVSNFDTSKVTHMSYIFYNCSSLITLKLGIFNTSKVSSYSNIFSKINSNTILYTYSQNTKDWILNLSSSNRPSSWTTDNIKVICSKNESGHNFETITTEPTCTENGKQVKTCTYCGYKEEIVLKAGHNFEVVTNNEGNKELVCSRCNEHREYHDYTIDIISNTNYVQDNNKFTSNIKGVNNGKSSIELTLTVYETTNFNFKYKVSSESRYDKGSLTIDGVTVADAISGTSNSEQTYTKILVPGTYTITSSYMKDSSANNGDDCFYFTVECGHIWDNGTITKEPTCTEAGTKVYKCTNDDCDVTKTETIKALGHNWDNGIVTKEPTCTDTGTKICTCSRDNVTKTETIKALGHDYNDNNVCTRCNDKLENPIFVGYSSSDNTLYFASKQKEIKNAGIDLTSDNYYGDISKINFASTSAPWENNSNITQITFLSEIKPTSCSYWFYKLDGLTKINNIKNLNTENCTKMNGMFDGCSKLTSLDLSDFDTSKVTSMRAMFTNCYGLKTINLSNFDTSNVKNMGSMFYCCSNLTSLDLSNFNTGNVTDMRYMFLACSDLTSLDVNNFDTSNVTNMSAMFEECVSLTTIDVSNFNTSKVTDMSSMFDGGFGGHNSLTTLDLSNFDTSNVTDMSNMFSKCTSLTTLDISSFNTNKVTNLSDMFSKCNSLSSLDISNFDTSNVTKMDGMFDRCSSLTSLDVSNFNTSKVTNISGMFSNCSKLTTLDVSSFDTSKVTDISGMFYNCTSLTTLDVSNFNTSNVTTMKSMFAKCLKLTHIDGLENFNTSKVTDMSLMFGASSYIGDGKIIFDNISNWDTHNVKDMTCMFYGQGAQTELDISKWNVSNCTSFNHMFCDNNKLKKLDLSKWDVSNVKTVYDMFDDCYALTTIGNVSNWNTSNMVDLGGFMNGCNNFEGSNGTLDLSGWDTSNVISMGEMFRACKKLTQIKLNNFDTSKVTDGSWTGAGSGIYYEYGNNSNEYKGMSIMFKDCPNLTSIIVGSKWSTDGKTTTNMFLNCGTDHVTIQ